jgi:hypothetical protein
MRWHVKKRSRLHCWLTALFVLMAGVGSLSPLSAHHSFAVFDHTQTVTVAGVVTKFQWTNPHGFLELDYTGVDGKTKHYTIELTSINMLSRAGWNSRSIKPGEKVTAIAAPLLSGEPGGLLLEVTLADGRTLSSPVPGASTFTRTPEQRLK